MNPKAFLELIHKKRKFYGIKYYDFFERIELSKVKYKRRRKDPGKFTLEEAGKIMKVLQFTEDERRMVFSENS